MFWERFYGLCVSRGTKPNPVAKELGISSGTISKWKSTGTLPGGETIIMLSQYFGCSADYLLGLSQVISSRNDEFTNTLTADEKRLLEKYRGLDEDGRDSVKGVIVAEQRRVESNRGERKPEAI